MNDEMMVLTLILLMGCGIGLAIQRILDNLILFYYKIKAIRQNNIEFKNKQAEVDKMKAAGDFHEWQEIPTMHGMLLVCKKTGWCPSLNGFIEQSRINSYLEAAKMDEEYKAFRKERINNLASKLVLTIADTEKIVEEIFSMKKDFHLMKTTLLQQELQAKAAHVESQGNKI